jgi:hypothetical protein
MIRRLWAYLVLTARGSASIYRPRSGLTLAEYVNGICARPLSLDPPHK